MSKMVRDNSATRLTIGWTATVRFSGGTKFLILTTGTGTFYEIKRAPRVYSGMEREADSSLVSFSG
jgi:hypothetical protein